MSSKVVCLQAKYDKQYACWEETRIWKDLIHRLWTQVQDKYDVMHIMSQIYLFHKISGGKLWIQSVDIEMLRYVNDLTTKCVLLIQWIYASKLYHLHEPVFWNNIFV